MTDFDPLKSTWNQAQSVQMRLHFILINLSDFKRRKDYGAWLSELDVYYTELCPLMSEEERKEYLDLLRLARNSISTGNPSNSKFMQTELFLRDIQQAKGMYMTTVEDPGAALNSGRGF